MSYRDRALKKPLRSADGGGLTVEREEKGRADHVRIPTQDFERGKVISIAEVRALGMANELSPSSLRLHNKDTRSPTRHNLKCHRQNSKSASRL
jgi:hypothetical protein